MPFYFDQLYNGFCALRSDEYYPTFSTILAQCRAVMQLAMKRNDPRLYISQQLQLQKVLRLQ
jgi:hypothetical protein